MIERIRKSTTRLDRMINDLLDVSRIETGRLALERVDTDLVPWLDDAVGRLALLAPANAVVISAVTARLVQGVFALEALGTHTLHGVAEPMVVHRVRGLLATPSRDEEFLTAAVPVLVGREEESGMLRRRWAQSKAGVGQVVLISGEAGIGKSALVEGLRAQVRAEGSWGNYSGGPAPGLSLTVAEWLANNEIAGYATDTWGTEVIPNETPDVFQPLHCVAIVNMGMLVGEIFNLEELAADCAADGVCEFLFVAPPLTITGAVGSPINPQAIK